MVIAIVGAGGKTTVLYCLGHKLSAMGRRVLLTTTTRIYRPDDIPLYLGPPERLRPDAPLMAAASGMAETRKLAGYGAGDIGAITSLGLFDDILVEADGAARRPIKSPTTPSPCTRSLSISSSALSGWTRSGIPRRKKTYTACRCLRA